MKGAFRNERQETKEIAGGWREIRREEGRKNYKKRIK